MLCLYAAITNHDMCAEDIPSFFPSPPTVVLLPSIRHTFHPSIYQ